MAGVSSAETWNEDDPPRPKREPILFRTGPPPPSTDKWIIPRFIGRDPSERMCEPDPVAVRNYVNACIRAVQAGNASVAGRTYTLLCKLFAVYDSGYDPDYIYIESAKAAAEPGKRITRSNRGNVLANAILSIEMLAMHPRLSASVETLTAIHEAGFVSFARALALGLDVRADLYPRAIRASLTYYERHAEDYEIHEYPDTGLDLIKTLACFLVALASPTLDPVEIDQVVKETRAVRMCAYHAELAGPIRTRAIYGHTVGPVPN